MKIMKVVALLLVCALLLGGCSLVSIDKDKVADLVVAKVNDTEIYKYEISEDDVQYSVQYQVSLAQQYYGISYTQEEIDQMVVDQRETSLQNRVKEEVLLQKAAELGIELTEEEKAENMQDAQDSLDSIMDYFIDQVKQEMADEQSEALAESDADTEDTADTTGDTADTSDTENTDTAGDTTDEPEATEEPADPAVLAEAQVRYDDYITQNKVTLESEYENFCRQDIITKVRDYAVSFAEVTDEDVRTWYDQTLELQQEEMDADPSVFGQKIAGNNIYTYVPERIVAVRDILISFDDTLATDLKTAYDEENTSQYDVLLSAALSEFSGLVDSANDVKERIEGGEEPADIVEEMSAEMDNIFDNTPDYGYIIDPRTTDYSDSFVKAATGLETVGEVSDTFADYDGVHVLQLMKVYEPGVIPFEDLKDDIKTALIPGAEEDMYDQMVEQWMEEADIKYYYDRLNSYNDL